MSANFFDNVTEFAAKRTVIFNVMAAFALLAAAYVFCQVFNGAGNYVSEMMIKKMEGVLSFGIHIKISHLKAVDFEQADKLYMINKVAEGKKSAVQLVYTIQGVICFYMLYFIFMGYYLFTLQPI